VLMGGEVSDKGTNWQGVGVMKDKGLKLEIEVSHTLGGTGEGHVQRRE
jgi:hypothetical protein